MSEPTTECIYEEMLRHAHVRLEETLLELHCANDLLKKWRSALQNKCIVVSNLDRAHTTMLLDSETERFLIHGPRRWTATREGELAECKDDEHLIKDIPF